MDNSLVWLKNYKYIEKNITIQEILVVSTHDSLLGVILFSKSDHANLYSWHHFYLYSLNNNELCLRVLTSKVEQIYCTYFSKIWTKIFQIYNPALFIVFQSQERLVKCEILWTAQILTSHLPLPLARQVFFLVSCAHDKILEGITWTSRAFFIQTIFNIRTERLRPCTEDCHRGLSIKLTSSKVFQRKFAHKQ